MRHSVLEYASSDLGYKDSNRDNIQNRALWYFIGIYRFAPLLAMHGDTGLIASHYRLL